MNLIKKSVYESLPDINSEFEDSGKGDRALMLIADENSLNGIFKTIQSIERFYSMRDFMAADPRFSQFAGLLTTSTLAMAIPQFKEDYGEGKAFDVVGTLAHDFFKSRIEDAQPSGVTLDKNGILKISFNMGAQIIVEREPGEWEHAREFFITL